MEIGIIANNLDHAGGAQRIAIMQCKLLLERGYKVTLFTQRLKKEECFPELLDNLEVKTYTTGYSPFFIKAYKRFGVPPIFPECIERKDIAIVHCDPMNLVGLHMKRRFKAKYILYANAKWNLLYPVMFKGELRRRLSSVRGGGKLKSILKKELLLLAELYLKYYDKKSVLEADHYLTSCDKMAKELYNIYKRKPEVVPYGVSYIEPSRPNSIRMNLDNPKYVILYVGRIHPYKSIKEAIEAFHIAKLQDAVLVIIGPVMDENYYEEIKVLLRSLDLESRVQFMGSQTGQSLANYYECCDFVIYPTYDEPFGLIALEALQYGKPSIIGNDSGVATELKDACVLVDPSDVNNISESIQELAQNKEYRSRLVAIGKEKLKEFTWERHINMLISLIES